MGAMVEKKIELVTEIPIVVFGSLDRLRGKEPVLFEAICLIDGLSKLGFRLGAFEDDQAPARALVQVTNSVDMKKSLFPEHAPDAAGRVGVYVLLTVPSVREVEVGEQGRPGEFGIDFSHELSWCGAVGLLSRPDSEEDFRRRWRDAVSAFATSSRDEGERAWESSRAASMLPSLARVLHAKGIKAP